jgi:hypothetical protein
MDESPDKTTARPDTPHCVILEGIDSSHELPDSFALRLSIRTGVALPRAMHVASNLPYTVKSGLTAAQAETLAHVLEGIGGVVRVEAHRADGPETPDMAMDLRSGDTEPQETVVCPRCGWEEGRWATHCSICLRRFRDPWSKSGTLTDRLPDENPLTTEDAVSPGSRSRILAFINRCRLPILLGVIAAIVILVLK